MGLEEFDIAPDNKGGRPPKSSSSNDEGDDSTHGVNRSHGEPYTPARDGDTEWWEEQVDEVTSTSFLDDDESGFSDDYTERKKEIMQLSDRLHINTIDLREKLAAEGIYETDWEEYVEREFDGDPSARIPGVSKSSSSSSSSPSFGSGSSEASDGLQSLVNNAK